MRTLAVRILSILWLGVCLGVGAPLPARTSPFALPTEKLAGLTPGVSTVADAECLHGKYDLAMPGDVLGYAGGASASKAYYWSCRPTLNWHGMVVETSFRSSVISAVMVDAYPGVATRCGLTTLMSDRKALDLYGLPNYAFEFRSDDYWFRELYYLDQGLLLVLNQVPERPDWTITTMILTYPSYLRNAVATRTQYTLACGRRVVVDITHSYQVWARLAYSPD